MAALPPPEPDSPSRFPVGGGHGAPPPVPQKRQEVQDLPELPAPGPAPPPPLPMTPFSSPTGALGRRRGRKASDPQSVTLRTFVLTQYYVLNLLL